MKTPHTPTPWATDYNTRENRFQLRSEKTGSFGHFHGWSSDGVTTEEEDEANAEFIVRAVNSHQALVDALTKANNRIWSYAQIHKGDGTSASENAMAEFRANQQLLSSLS